MEVFAPEDVIRRLSPEEAAEHIAREAAASRQAAVRYRERLAANELACRAAPASASRPIAAYQTAAAAFRAAEDRGRAMHPDERPEAPLPEWCAMADAARAALNAGMPHDATSARVLLALGLDPAPGRLQE